MDNDPVRVLLVEDDEDDFLLTRDLLADIPGNGFCLDWVADYDAALEAIGRCAHDVYLLDYHLGRKNGLELLREGLRRGCTAPIILLTGQGEREVDFEAMRSGAADYLEKSQLDASQLERAIRYALQQKRHQEELERKVQERTAELARANQVLQAEVAERRRAEDALRESEQRFRQLADSMPQIVWAARPDGYLDYYNERWYEYTGFPRDVGGDESWKPILHPDDVQLCLDTWHAAVRSGKPYEIEYRFKDRLRGGYRWHLGRALPVRDAAGRIVRWFGTCTDIHDQKRAEEALKESDRRKDEFLAMLGHELRNPLAPIRNAVQVLKLKGAAEPVAEQARDVIDRQVSHMARLIDDLLDVSRISRGKILLRKERLDLTELVRATVEDHRAGFDAAGVRLSVQRPDRPVWVFGDPTRLAQVLGNMLHNAIKFTDPGGRAFVELAAELENRHAVLIVRDTGIGMEPEMLARVFETFSQADCSLDRSRGGLGLGLALVKGLIDLHGGTVSAASAGPGRGAEFTVRLPLAAEPARPADRPTVPGRPRRILVIEDNRDAADSMRLLLELTGHQVEVAYAGPAGIEAARRFHPEVVLCDIGLPGGMDGYAVARTLRQEAGLVGAFLVALTGYGQDEDLRRAHQAGFDRHLTKPVDFPELQQVLAAIPATR